MRDYGKVQTAFWTSGDIQLLSDDGKLLALYLLSSPHTNQIGCFRLPDGYVAEDLKWTNERVSKGFDELSNNGFSNRDAVSKWVVIHKFTKWNEIENPNQAKAAIKLFDQVPDSSSVKAMLVRALREFSPRFLDDFLKKIETVSKGLVEPFLNQEQEQEQEQEQKQEQEKEKPSAKAPKFDFAGKLSELGADEKSIRDWLAVRKVKRAANTETVIENLVREAAKAQISVADAVLICATKSWQGFEADWLKPKDRASPQRETIAEKNERIMAAVMGNRVDDGMTIEMGK